MLVHRFPFRCPFVAEATGGWNGKFCRNQCQNDACGSPICQFGKCASAVMAIWAGFRWIEDKIFPFAQLAAAIMIKTESSLNRSE
jgi:hypothetical protein